MSEQQKLFASGGECWDDHEYPHITAAKDKAHARRTDPDTSHQAARSVTNLGRTRDLIREILKEHGPQTDENLITLYKNKVLQNDLWKSYKMASDSGIRTRRKELVSLGFVRMIDKEGKTRSGNSSIRWGFVK